MLTQCVNDSHPSFPSPRELFMICAWCDCDQTWRLNSCGGTHAIASHAIRLLKVEASARSSSSEKKNIEKTFTKKKKKRKTKETLDKHVKKQVQQFKPVTVCSLERSKKIDFPQMEIEWPLDNNYCSKNKIF